MHVLDTRVPPPVVTAVFAGLMYLTARLLPLLAVPFPYRQAVGVAVALTGLLLEVIAAVTFQRACTTVNPLNPAAATSVVTAGVYRYTRNPIYLGDLLLLLGWGYFLGNVGVFALVPLFIAYINAFQIAPEERALEAKFGAQYTEYRSRVRRWV